IAWPIDTNAFKCPGKFGHITHKSRIDRGFKLTAKPGLKGASYRDEVSCNELDIGSTLNGEGRPDGKFVGTEVVGVFMVDRGVIDRLGRRVLELNNVIVIEIAAVVAGYDVATVRRRHDGIEALLIGVFYTCPLRASLRGLR